MSADAAGDFEADLFAEDLDAMVSLRASDPTDRFLEFASLIGPTSAVLSKAGVDRALTPDEDRATILSGFTTVWYAAILKENDGRIPENDARLRSLEIATTKWVLDHDATLVEAGAVLHRLSASPSLTRPATQSLLSLALDTEMLRNVLEETDRTAALDYVLGIPSLFEPFTSTEVVDVVEDLLPEGNGYAGGSGTSYTFEPGGRGQMQEAATSCCSVGPPLRFAWSSSVGVSLSIQLQPAESVPYFFATEDVPALFSNAANGQVVLQALRACGIETDAVIRQFVGMEVRRLPGGENATPVLVRRRYVYRFDLYLSEVCRAPGAIGEAVEDTTSLWIRRDSVPSVPWSTEKVLEPRTMTLATEAPFDSPFLNYEEGDLLFVDHVLALNADQTGTAVSMFPARTLQVEWRLLVDGRLEIKHDLGTHIITRIAILPTEESIFVDYLGNDGQTAFRVWRTRPVDPSFRLEPGVIETGTGVYWQSLVNWGITPLLPDGTLPADDSTRFGFRFLSEGHAEQLRIGTSSVGRPQLLRETDYRYLREDDRLSIGQWIDQNDSLCIPGDLPDCFALTRRTWRPVALDQGILYVLEMKSFSRFYGDMVWDEAAGTYVIPATGEAVNPNEGAPDVLPRLNAYRLDEVPEL